MALTALGAAIACSSAEHPPGSAGKAGAAASSAASTATPEMLRRGREIYATNCAACHGMSGKGDGPGAAALTPPPRDQTDRAYMATLSDEDIAEVIRMGGAPKGKPFMPSHPHISGRDMDALVAYVRSLSAPK